MLTREQAYRQPVLQFPFAAEDSESIRERVARLLQRREMKWFVRGDIDGLFGLFVDNLLQLLLILTLCPLVCGFPPDFVVGTVLPGAAISVAAGNFFYAWQARRLALIDQKFRAAAG